MRYVILALIIIRGHCVLLKSSLGTWMITNVHNLPMLGLQIRLSSDLWFLEMGALHEGHEV